MKDVFNAIGILLFIIGGIYFVLGMRDKKERE
jgi:cbb3-type cytochrome oxidase subunit 3